MSQLPGSLSGLSSRSAVVSAACRGIATAARPNEPAINPLIDMCYLPIIFVFGVLARPAPHRSDRATSPCPPQFTPEPGRILLERKALRQRIAKISRHGSKDIRPRPLGSAAPLQIISVQAEELRQEHCGAAFPQYPGT